MGLDDTEPRPGGAPDVADRRRRIFSLLHPDGFVDGTRAPRFFPRTPALPVARFASLFPVCSTLLRTAALLIRPHPSFASVEFRCFIAPRATRASFPRFRCASTRAAPDSTRSHEAPPNFAPRLATKSPACVRTRSSRRVFSLSAARSLGASE